MFKGIEFKENNPKILPQLCHYIVVPLQAGLKYMVGLNNILLLKEKKELEMQGYCMSE